MEFSDLYYVPSVLEQWWETKLTFLNSLADEPGVEIILKGLDLKQLNIPAA